MKDKSKRNLYNCRNKLEMGSMTSAIINAPAIKYPMQSMDMLAVVLYRLKITSKKTFEHVTLYRVEMDYLIRMGKLR